MAIFWAGAVLAMITSPFVIFGSMSAAAAMWVCIGGMTIFHLGSWLAMDDNLRRARHGWNTVEYGDRYFASPASRLTRTLTGLQDTYYNMRKALIAAEKKGASWRVLHGYAKKYQKLTDHYNEIAALSHEFEAETAGQLRTAYDEIVAQQKVLITQLENWNGQTITTRGQKKHQKRVIKAQASVHQLASQSKRRKELAQTRAELTRLQIELESEVSKLSL